MRRRVRPFPTPVAGPAYDRKEEACGYQFVGQECPNAAVVRLGPDPRNWVWIDGEDDGLPGEARRVGMAPEDVVKYYHKDEKGDADWTTHCVHYSRFNDAKQPGHVVDPFHPDRDLEVTDEQKFILTHWNPDGYGSLPGKTTKRGNLNFWVHQRQPLLN
jgi:hypothetical protein